MGKKKSVLTHRRWCQIVDDGVARLRLEDLEETEKLAELDRSKWLRNPMGWSVGMGVAAAAVGIRKQDEWARRRCGIRYVGNAADWRYGKELLSERVRRWVTQVWWEEVGAVAWRKAPIRFVTEWARDSDWTEYVVDAKEWLRTGGWSDELVVNAFLKSGGRCDRLAESVMAGYLDWIEDVICGPVMDDELVRACVAALAALSTQECGKSWVAQVPNAAWCRTLASGEMIVNAWIRADGDVASIHGDAWRQYIEWLKANGSGCEVTLQAMGMAILSRKKREVLQAIANEYAVWSACERGTELPLVVRYLVEGGDAGCVAQKCLKPLWNEARYRCYRNKRTMIRALARVAAQQPAAISKHIVDARIIELIQDEVRRVPRIT